MRHPASLPDAFGNRCVCHRTMRLNEVKKQMQVRCFYGAVDTAHEERSLDFARDDSKTGGVRQ